MSAELIFHEVLQAMKGKTIKVFRGGPESKEGYLLDSMDDFFVILSGDSIIYYQTLHVQNITEDAKTNSFVVGQDIEEVKYHSSQTFAELLRAFIEDGTHVKVNLGGPESRSGVIVDAGEDFIALFTKEDGIVFYSLVHVKSVSEKIDSSKKFHLKRKKEESEESCECECASKSDSDSDSECSTQEYYLPPFPQVRCFSDLFTTELTPWVSINRGGPHALEGILVSNSTFLKLVNNQEVIFIHPEHVKSFNLGMKGSGKKIQELLQEDNQSEECSDSNDNSSNNDNNNNNGNKKKHDNSMMSRRRR